jgi:RNA 3'-terminal phosphate cyclase (ATP)
MLTIDGSRGEGGGQMLRTSLALALVTGSTLRMTNIRARREKPGLRPQHLAAVKAAATIGRATVEGAGVGSREIVFRPAGARAGDYHFDIGTAGSTGLVLQAVLPALLTVPGASTVTIEGGTHNPMAPPFEFLARAFLPLVARMGPRLDARLERHGFYPAGGGRLSVRIESSGRLEPLTLLERGAVLHRLARAIVAKLPAQIAERELAVVRDRLGLDAASAKPVVVADSAGPGNAVMIEIVSEHVTEVFTAIGERGLRAERVAEQAAENALDYLRAGVPIGPHLADQLLLPLALARGGAFLTTALTSHGTTNMDVIRRFLDVDFAVSHPRADQALVEVRPSV